MEQAVNLTDAAKSVGVHKATISRYVSRGLVPNHGSPSAPMVKVSEVRAAREGGIDPSKQRGHDAPLFAEAVGERRSPESEDEEAEAAGGDEAQPKKGDLTFTKARTAREAAQARMAQIDLSERLGQLLDRREVEDAFFTFSAIVRDELMAQGARLAADLTGLTEPGEIIAKLDEANREILKRLEKEFAKLAAPDAAAAA